MVKLIKTIRTSEIYRSFRSKFNSTWSQKVFHSANSLSKTLIRIMHAKHGMRINFSGTWMYVDPIYFLEHEIPREDPMLRSLLERVQPGDVFVDVGAYIGMYSIPVARKYPGTVKVLAFEPAPDNFLLLQKHIRMNELEESISAFNLACGRPADHESISREKFLIAGSISSESRMACNKVREAEDEKPDFKTIEVGIAALDDFLAGRGITPNIIKIDVEGYELEVLKGSRDVMLQSKPTIFCEIHKFNWDIYSSSEEIFWGLLSEVKYRVTDLKGEELTDLPDYGHVVISPSKESLSQ